MHRRRSDEGTKENILVLPVEYSGSGYTASPVVGNRNSGKMETMDPVA